MCPVSMAGGRYGMRLVLAMSSASSGIGGQTEGGCLCSSRDGRGG